MLLNHTEASDTLVIALGKPSRALRTTYYTMLVLLVAAVVWASVSVVDISVHAPGAVRPAEGVQNVQSTQTAYLAALKVREGAWVNAGDTLATLEAQSITQRQSLQREKYQRLQHEIDDLRQIQSLNTAAQFHFPLYANELALRLKERDIIQQEWAVLDAKFKRSEDLYGKKFVSSEKYEQAKFQREQKELALKQWQQNVMKSASERLQQMELQRTELEGELRLLGIERERMVLRAPTSGVVTVLNIKSAGVLLKAGETLCAISPADAGVAEFYVAAKDVGFVAKGLQVKCQMEAFPFQEWGMLTGRVQSVAGDFTVNDKNDKAAQFKVIALFNGLQLRSQRQGKTVCVKSGMTFRANVVVARKRVITMLWDKTVGYFSL
jgi:HlyD family secretion protein